MSSPTYRSFADRIFQTGTPRREFAPDVDRSVMKKVHRMRFLMQTRTRDGDVELAEIARRLDYIIREESHRKIPELNEAEQTLLDAF
jgi:hypothetical protein